MVSLSTASYVRRFDSSLSSIAYNGINRGVEPIFGNTSRNVFSYFSNSTENRYASDLLLSSAPAVVSLMTLGGLYAIYNTLKRGFKEGKIMKKMKPFKMPKAFKDLEEFVLPNGYQFPEKYPYHEGIGRVSPEVYYPESRESPSITKESRQNDIGNYQTKTDNPSTNYKSIATSLLPRLPSPSGSRDLSRIIEPTRTQSRNSNRHYTEENNTREEERTHTHYDSNRSSGDSSYTRRQTNGMSIDDAFSMFGVDRNASFEDAKKAYRKSMVKNHPNYNQGDYDKIELTKRLNKAWEMIQKYYNRKV
jgi:hypothetical protein